MNRRMRRAQGGGQGGGHGTHSRKQLERLERQLKNRGHVPLSESGAAGRNLIGRGISPLTAALGGSSGSSKNPGRASGMARMASELSGILGGDDGNRWQVRAPRLPEGQQVVLFGILRRVHAKYASKEITRETFPKIHERMGLEIAERISDTRALKGLIVSLEWRGYFSPEGHRYYNELRRSIGEPPHREPFLDCHMTPENRDALDGELFDMMGMFSPCVVAHQYPNESAYFDSAEESIDEAARRAKAGDGYFSERDRQMGQGVSSAPLSSPKEMQGDGGGE